MPRKEPLRTSYGNKSGAGGADTNQQLPWIGYRCDGECRRAPAAEKEGRRWQRRDSGEGRREGGREGGRGVKERAKERGGEREGKLGGREEGRGGKEVWETLSEREESRNGDERREVCLCVWENEPEISLLAWQNPSSRLGVCETLFGRVARARLWSGVDQTDLCLQSLTGHPTSAARQPRVGLTSPLPFSQTGWTPADSGRRRESGCCPCLRQESAGGRRGVSPRRCPSRRQAGFHAARRNQQGTGWE